jgi:5-methylcytosine-specific restriction protein A
MLRPKHACGRPGCPTLVDERYCEAHSKRPDTRRGQGYEQAPWKKYSKVFLAKHPLCADPFKRHPHRFVPATCTGHKVAHKGDVRLYWSPANHVALCASCNAHQCASYEGGFGNPIRGVGGKAQ